MKSGVRKHINKCAYCDQAASGIDIPPGGAQYGIPMCEHCTQWPLRPIPRVGEGMIAAILATEGRPGLSAYALAKMVGPNGSATYGYAIVRRTVRAGLLYNAGTEARSRLHLTTLAQWILWRGEYPAIRMEGNQACLAG